MHANAITHKETWKYLTMTGILPIQPASMYIDADRAAFFSDISLGQVLNVTPGGCGNQSGGFGLAGIDIKGVEWITSAASPGSRHRHHRVNFLPRTSDSQICRWVPLWRVGIEDRFLCRLLAFSCLDLHRLKTSICLRIFRNIQLLFILFFLALCL